LTRAPAAGSLFIVPGKLAAIRPPRGKPKRPKSPLILVVDDCPDAREVFAGYLRYAGFVVEVAADGRGAIEMAVASEPAVVLMDLNMPVMDGWEATRQLKRDPRTAGIPVIAVSAHVSADGSALAAGCDAIVPKPCPPQHLVTCVLRALSSARRVAG
jgi:CheY-like chemotaxis protein